MVDITQLPDLGIAQFEQVGYENPRLAAPIDEDDTTLTFTAPLKDEDNTQFNKAIIIGVKNLETKYTENILIPAGGMSSDGLTATGCIRGLQLSGVNGIDISTTVTANAIAHPQDSEVRVIVSAHLIQAILKVLFGSIATGGNDLILGKATNEIVTIHHKDGSSTKGFLRKHPTSAKVQFSNDGSSWVNLDAAGVGTITWGDGLNGGSGNDDPYVELANTPAFLTGDTGAQSVAATWAAVTNGSFRIGIDGTNYNVDGINFSTAVTMADVASIIQIALRAVTGGTETVVWSTNKFIITSANYTASSAVTVTSTSTGTVGTDISGAGASDWMDCDTGNGTATAVAESSGLTMLSGRLSLLKTVIQNATWVSATDAEASDAYAITVSPVPAAYALYQVFQFKANTANTGAASLNVNGLGAITIKKNRDQDLETGDIEANSIVVVVYDGTNFQMKSQLALEPLTKILIDAKGDMIIGTADNTVSRLAIGANNTIPVADSAEATGIKWEQKVISNANVASRDLTAASGVQTIAHGLGIAPKYVRFSGFEPGTHNDGTIGWSNGSTNESISFLSGTVQDNAGAGCMVFQQSGASQTAVCTVDATNITLTWTKSGSPSGTAQFLWEAYA